MSTSTENHEIGLRIKAGLSGHSEIKNAATELFRLRDAIVAARQSMQDSLVAPKMDAKMQRGIEDWRAEFDKAFSGGRGKKRPPKVGVKDLAERFGIDVDELVNAAHRAGRKFGETFQRAVRGNKLNPGQASDVLGDWSVHARKQATEAANIIKRTFAEKLGTGAAAGGAGGVGRPAVVKGGSARVGAADIKAIVDGKIQLIIPASQIHATVAGGAIQATVAGGGAGSVAGGGIRPPAGTANPWTMATGQRPVATPPPPSSGGASIPPPASSQPAAASSGPGVMVRRVRDRRGRTTETYINELGHVIEAAQGGSPVVKTTDPILQRLTKRISRRQQTVLANAAAMIAAAKGSGDFGYAAQSAVGSARQLQRLGGAVATHPRIPANERAALAGQIAAQATKLEGKAAGLAAKFSETELQTLLYGRKQAFSGAMRGTEARPGGTRAEVQRGIVDQESGYALQQMTAAGRDTREGRQWRQWLENLDAQNRNLRRQQAEQEAGLTRRSMADANRHSGRMETAKRQRHAAELKAEKTRINLARDQQSLTLTRASAAAILGQARAEGYGFDDFEGTTFDLKKGRVIRAIKGAREAGGKRYGLGGRLEYRLNDYLAELDSATGRVDWSRLSGRETGGSLSTSVAPVKTPGGVARKPTGSGGKWGDSRLTGGGSYTSNLATVSAWSTAVWSLYGAIGLARKGLASLTETGFQTQRLEQVFSKVGGSTLALRDDVLALAAANGRSAGEAMEASVQWARLGLSYQQTAEAVRVSMIAANVAELSVADTTKHLQGIMQAYSLRVSELSGVLSQMNAISNNWNVTNAEMMDGMARTASVAKQAGIPLAELMAMIGGTVGFTGQSGANIGNAIKSFATSLAKPDIQEFLRKDFGLNVNQGEMGEVKNLNAILGELWETYTGLTRAEQQYLLVKTARRTQASRMAALLDAYVPIQALAINAQLQMNSAQEENALILQSLRSGWRGVVTEMERFIALQARGGWVGTKITDATRGARPGGIAVGPEAFMRGGLQAAQNVMSLLNTPAGSTATAGLSAMLTALGLRMGLSGIMGASRQASLVRAGKMERGDLRWLARTFYDATAIVGRGGESAGLLADGARRQRFPVWRGIASGFSRRPEAWQQSKGEGGAIRMTRVASHVPALRLITGGARVATRAVASLGVAFLELAPLVALVVGATWGFNRVMEALGFSSATADDKLSKLTKTFEEHQAAAEAAGQSVTFYQRLLRTLPTMSESKRRESARFLASLGAGQRGLGIDEATSKAIEAGDREAYGPAIEAMIKRAQDIQMADRAAATAAKLNAVKVTQAEAIRLRDRGNEKGAQVKDREAAALMGDAIRINDQQEQDTMENLKASGSFQARQALQDQMVDQVRNLYEALPAANPAVAALNRAQGIAAQIGLVDARRDEISRRQKDFAGADAARDQRVKDLEKERDELLVARTKIQPDYDTSFEFSAVSKDQIDQKVRAIDAEIAATKASQAEGQRELNALDTTMSERREKLMAELGGATAGAAVGMIQMRVQQATGDAGAIADRHAIGDNATEQLLNRRAGLLQSIHGVESTIADMKARGLGHEEQSVRLLEYQRQLMEANVSLGREAYAVAKSRDELEEKSRRRQQEAMLGAGPGEMLQHIGAWRLTHDRLGNQRRIGVGEFMSWSPRMREMAGIWNPDLTAEGRALNRRRLQAARINPGALREENLNLIGRQARTVGELQDPWVKALGAAQDLDGFRTSVTQAGLALEGFVSRVESLLKNGGANQDAPGFLPPVLPQGSPISAAAVNGVALALRQ